MLFINDDDDDDGIDGGDDGQWRTAFLFWLCSVFVQSTVLSVFRILSGHVPSDTFQICSVRFH